MLLFLHQTTLFTKTHWLVNFEQKVKKMSSENKIEIFVVLLKEVHLFSFCMSGAEVVNFFSVLTLTPCVTAFECVIALGGFQLTLISAIESSSMSMWVRERERCSEAENDIQRILCLPRYLIMRTSFCEKVWYLHRVNNGYDATGNYVGAFLDISPYLSYIWFFATLLYAVRRSDILQSTINLVLFHRG